LDSGEVYQLPLFAMRYVMIYSLPTQNYQDDAIILDFPTMSDIWAGRITNWNHPYIQALNPTMVAAGTLPNLNITRIVSTAGSREIERRFLSILAGQTSGTVHSFPLVLDEYGSNKALADSPWVKNQTGVVYVGSEYKVQAAVDNLPGAIGIASITSALEETTMRTRLQKKTGEVITESVAASYACFADTFNITNGRFRLPNSKNPDCWTFTTTIYTMVRASNTGDECVNAPRALKFLQFLHDRKFLTALHQHECINGVLSCCPQTETSTAAEAATFLGTTVTDSAVSTEASELARRSQVAEALGALWQPPDVRAIMQARLQSVTCDGETILVTLPIDHRIGLEVQNGALGVSVIGACLIVLILCFLYFFHLRSAIKASSPVFLIATVVGMLFLFISGALLTQNDPSNHTCESGWWLLNVGFFLTFSPLFAKTWYNQSLLTLYHCSFLIISFLDTGESIRSLCAKR
jgi:ABC-type phosphate transport system substrate-binding protein